MDIKAYTEGKTASIKFKSNPKLCENPYPPNTLGWEDWNYGWNSDMSCVKDIATHCAM